jgi:hypothetical protein
MIRAPLRIAGKGPLVEFFIVFSVTGRRSTIPPNARFLVSLGLSSLTSVVAIVGPLQVLPPPRVHRVVLLLLRLRGLHRRQSSPRRLRPRVLLLLQLDLRPQWRWVMRVPRIAFAGMGMTRGQTLNLTGLFLCIHCLPSVNLSHLPVQLHRLGLGCPWSRTPRPCWIRTLCRMISFSLRDLCRRCTGPSPLRHLWRDFDWLWRTLVPWTTWSRTVWPSFHTRRFGTFVFAWVTIPLLLS